MSVLSRRVGEVAALVTIGDAMMALLKPKEHAALWRGGPQWWDGMINYFEQRPNLTRALGAAGLVAGIWFAARQENREVEER